MTILQKDQDRFLGGGGLHYDVTRLPCSVNTPRFIYSLNKRWSSIYSWPGPALGPNSRHDPESACEEGEPAQGFGLCHRRTLQRTKTGQLVPFVVVWREGQRCGQELRSVSKQIILKLLRAIILKTFWALGSPKEGLLCALGMPGVYLSADFFLLNIPPWLLPAPRNPAGRDAKAGGRERCWDMEGIRLKQKGGKVCRAVDRGQTVMVWAVWPQASS